MPIKIWIILFVCLYPWPAEVNAADWMHDKANLEDYVHDPFVKEKFKQIDRRDREKDAKAAAHQDQQERAQKARDEAAAARAKEASIREAYAESRNARIKKVQRTRGQKTKSWQVLNR